MRVATRLMILGGLLGLTHCAAPDVQPQPTVASPAAAPLAQPELAPAPRLRSATPSYVRLARVEGYGNPKTGELWVRAVPLVEGITGFEHGGPRGQSAPEQVAVSGQELGRSHGFCEATYDSDGVPNNNPAGTLEFYNQYDATGNVADQSSFVAATCLSKLPAAQQTPIHSTLFTSQGVGCARQHVGNFTGTDYSRLLLDVDVFNGTLSAHGPYGPPFTTGTVRTPSGRNPPQQDLGLWDFGPMPSGNPGQTSGPHLKEMWIYFMNGDSNDFNWTGYILGEVFEECGDDDDDDCDGEDDNGCGTFVDGADCYSDLDCLSSFCDGAEIVSGFGMGGGDLGEDLAGSCEVMRPRVDAGGDTTCRVANNELTCWGYDGPNLVASVPGGATFAQVSVGTDHICALQVDGELACWGSNAQGQGTAAGGDDYVSVSAGASHNCALHADGGITCWGDNGSGQATAPAGNDYSAVAAGYRFSCAVRHNGTVACWGDDAHGQTEPPAGSVYTRITTGRWHACGIAANDTVECWGEDAAGQATSPAGVTFLDISAGYGHTCGLREDGSLQCWGDNVYGQSTPPVGTNFVSVTAGDGHSCAVRDDESVVCWGYNGFGQTTVPLIPLVPTPELSTVSAGWNHGCAIMPDTGKVKCWGENDISFPRLGLAYGAVWPAKYFQALATEAPDRKLGNLQALHVSSGFAHSCVLLDDQTVRCFGDNTNYQTRGGAGAALLVSATDSVPTALAIGGPAVKVLAGGYHSCALRSDAELVCWGNNTGGKLGMNSMASVLPIGAPVPLPQPVADFCVGNNHTCALLQDGNLYCWGDNSVGQLGQGNTTTIGDNEAVSSVPPVSVLTTPEQSAGRYIQKIACGGDVSCAVLDDGKMRCWGGGAQGALGYGSGANIGDTELPNSMGYVDIGSGELVDQVTTGDGVTCTLSTNGNTKCWGYTQRVSGSSCLGHPAGCGTYVSTPPATNIDFGAGLKAVELADRSYSGTLCARLNNGSVRCWHVNSVYACGNNAAPNPLNFATGADTLPPAYRQSDVVLGQVESGSTFTNCGTGASNLCNPGSPVVDPISGKLFVVDTSNSRVLRYASADSLANGAPAELVFGQSGFVSGTPMAAANRMNNPQALTVDANGTLWVADTGNHRVLRFANAAAAVSHAPNADGVLGQINLVSNSQSNTAIGLSSPAALWADGSGRLWVSDTMNHRVLRFDNAAAVADADGGSASGVLGQAAFDMGTPTLSAAGMNTPRGLLLDSSERLWVADANNHRVLRFDGAAAKANGANADGVLGQPNLLSMGSGLSSSSMALPRDVAMDSAGRLFVLDGGNHRVMIFAAATLGSTLIASDVIGAPNLSTAYSGYAGDQLNVPAGMSIDGQNRLWIGDGLNSRVLMFLP